PRVRFAALDANSPQLGLVDREVAPASVAADGLSLTVLVPQDAVTGPVRLADETSGLILQIVPTLTRLDHQATFFDQGSSLRIEGRGFVEGTMTLLIGSRELADVWDGNGPNAFHLSSPTVLNGGADYPLP